MPDQTDPRKAGGHAIGTGDPMARDSVVFDARKAVLVEQLEVAVAHTTHAGEPAPDKVALVVNGRMNRPPDDVASAELPAEPISHLHMMGWDTAADLVVEIQALAARDGRSEDFVAELQKRWDKLEAEGLTRSAR